MSMMTTIFEFMTASVVISAGRRVRPSDATGGQYSMDLMQILWIIHYKMINIRNQRGKPR